MQSTQTTRMAPARRRRGWWLAPLAFYATTCWACRMAPAEQLVGVDEQVGAALDVALARVVDAVPLDGASVEYRFEVVQRFAGPARGAFTLVGRAASADEADTSFNHHRDPAFWARGGGRTMNDADCRIRPRFAVGSTYLVFLGAPTWRSFEKIDVLAGKVDERDGWFAYVAARLGPRAMGASARPDYERIGRFIYGFHRRVTRQELTSIEVAKRAPLELARRAQRLADDFDRILAARGDASDADMDAALREADDVGAALKAWRANGNG